MTPFEEDDPLARTVPMVTLAEHMELLAKHLELARVGMAMRKAQRTYFAKRKAAPHVSADVEYREARRHEKTFEAAAEDALNRDRQHLPGMEGGAR